jgi:uncharacterized protein YacL
VAGIYRSWGIALLAAFVGLLIGSFQPQISTQAGFWLRIASIVMFLGAIYGFIESVRFQHWKDNYYNEIEGTIIKEPPQNLLYILIRKVLRK